jgi:hypothetical protein
MMQSTMEQEGMGPTSPHNVGGSADMFLERLTFVTFCESY